MNFSLFSTQNHQKSNGKKIDISKAYPSVPGQVKKAMVTVPTSVRLLPPGETFFGEVRNVTGTKATIQCGNESIDARFDSSIPISIGERLNFVIRENTEDRFLIAPQFDSSLTQEDQMLYKALAGAGLAATDQNIDLVSALLRNQLPVNQNSVRLFLPYMTKHPQVNIEDMVLLYRYKLPISETNLQQISFVKNETPVLKETLEQLWNAIPESYQVDYPALKDAFMSPETNSVSDMFDQLRQVVKELMELAHAGSLNQELHEAGENAVSLLEHLAFLEELNMSFGKENGQQGRPHQSKCLFMLPLKLNGKNRQADLYVYSGNRQSSVSGSSAQDLQILLHLELEVLQNLNIMVKLRKRELTVCFETERKSITKLIQDAMPQLKNKLQELGFSVITTVSDQEHIPTALSKKEQQEEFWEPVQSRKELKRSAFDMRI